jgi:oligopeptide/dipeptide ABC transporter ATP-binding protein
MMVATELAVETRDLRREFDIRGGILGRRRGAVRAVDGVSLAIAPGETLGLVGESGSGKSTFGRLVGRLLEPSGGELLIQGREVGREKADRAARRSTQIVFQDPYSSFDPVASIGDSIAEPLRVHGVVDDSAARNEKVAELLELVGLSGETHARRRPNELSGGQLQRAAIARALAPDPAVVILDEPVSALDLSTQAQVVNLLDELQDRLHLSYLFIAHDLSVVRHVSDRIAVMYVGRIVEQGPAEAVYTAPRHPYTEALLSAIPIVDVSGKTRRERIILAGDIPSPASPQPGCRFHTRCPWVMEVCRHEDPPAYRTDDQVTVHCHLHTTGPQLAGASVRVLERETAPVAE